MYTQERASLQVERLVRLLGQAPPQLIPIHRRSVHLFEVDGLVFLNLLNGPAPGGWKNSSKREMPIDEQWERIPQSRHIHVVTDACRQLDVISPTVRVELL